MKKNLAFLLFLFLPYFSFAQIVIEERVEILPEGVNNILPFGSISGDSRNPTYLGYGGDVTLRTIHSSNPNLELWEESLGRLTITGTTSIGTFPQWHKFIFYFLDPSTGTKYYPEPGDLIVWDWSSATIDFYPSHQPGDPYPPNPEDWWEIEVSADYSLAAMPPEEILNYFGNPFQPTEPLEVAVDGNLYAVITYVGYDNFTQQDELWIDVPGVQLIQDNIGNFEYETFDLGHMTAGDSVRFFLRTQNSIVSGMNLYPKQIREEIFMPDGDILLWRLEFEDWTDLQFDDVEVEIYLTPDSLGSYPGPLEETIEPAEIAPGDTAGVVIKRRYLDGTLEDYPPEQLFEIGMIDGCEAGMILVEDSLGVYFEEVMQPIKFVADSSLTETDTVAIRVGLVEEIIGTRPININNLGNANKEVEMKREGGNTNPPMENPVTFCFPGFFNSTTLDDGNVVVEAHTILLGETKYFAVKKKEVIGVVEKIEIVEIEADYGVEPDFPASAGEGWQWVTQSDVWPAEPVEKIEGDEGSVYWETEKPVWNGNSKKGNLKEGMIRLIGRYWAEGTTNKVELKASIESKSANIIILVNKPSKLLTNDDDDSYRWSKDIRNNDLDIDNYLIKNGGEKGIPPQLLKGQLFVEAYHNENESFWPSYRYEPWADLRARNGKYKEDYKKQPYWVNENGMGVEDGGEPVQIDHYNIRPILNFSTPTPYPNSPMKIGDYVADNLGEYYAGTHLNRKFNGRPMYGPDKVQLAWETLVTYYLQYGKGDAEFLSDHFIRIYLKQTYEEYAQTRKMASYGYFQMLYTTAIVDPPGYPRKPGNYPGPEKLNDQDILTPYVMKHLKDNVTDKLKVNETFDSNNWADGYEQVWFNSYHKYNKRSDYDDDVFTHSKKFLPR